MVIPLLIGRRMAKVGISHCFDMDRLGHAGVKVKWEPVEARHGVNAQAEAQTEWKMVGDAETAPWKHSLRLNPGNASCRRSAPATPIIQSPA